MVLVAFETVYCWDYLHFNQMSYLLGRILSNLGTWNMCMRSSGWIGICGKNLYQVKLT